jgi:hypothetical protein
MYAYTCPSAYGSQAAVKQGTYGDQSRLWHIHTCVPLEISRIFNATEINCTFVWNVLESARIIDLFNITQQERK